MTIQTATARNYVYQPNDYKCLKLTERPNLNKGKTEILFAIPSMNIESLVYEVNAQSVLRCYKFCVKGAMRNVYCSFI